MVLFIILGLIVLITFMTLGVLSYMLNKEAQIESEAHKKRIQGLEDELRAVTLKAKEQSDQAKRLIESSHARSHLLEEEMAAVKTQMGEELSRAKATVAELNREREALLSAPKPAVDGALHQELETLKYELVKARAQSSGLERASFNYKNQLEDFLNKLKAAQASHDHLSQVKNQLEVMVQEIKAQNEALVKKDQLAQFELDKNRARLASLERECEDLKARIGQKEGQG